MCFLWVVIDPSLSMSPEKCIAHTFNFQNFLTFGSCGINLALLGLKIFPNVSFSYVLSNK